ncbi:MAG: LytR/AlgR family response regulator transcription factor [Bacteroidia bacterium]
MHSYNVLLVDDEFLALTLLEGFVAKIPDLNIVGKVKSPIEASEILRSQQVDMLFLDIQMPVLSGINLLKTIPNKPATIFTTAYAEHALEAYDLDVVDYLLKPFSFERFLQSVNKAKQHIGAPTVVAPNIDAGGGFLTFKADHKLVKIWIKDIQYIEGLREYVRIVCKEEKYVVLESLKRLEDTLPAAQFVRVHKSWIVNTEAVKSLEGNMLHLTDRTVPLSRERKAAVVATIFGKKE